MSYHLHGSEINVFEKEFILSNSKICLWVKVSERESAFFQWLVTHYNRVHKTSFQKMASLFLIHSIIIIMPSSEETNKSPKLSFHAITAWFFILGSILFTISSVCKEFDELEGSLFCAEFDHTKPLTTGSLLFTIGSILFAF